MNDPVAPRTQRMDHDDHTGKPCIHFTDHHDVAVQVHARPDAPGFYVAIAQRTYLAGMFIGVQSMTVDLTPGQVNELLAYLRENV